MAAPAPLTIARLRDEVAAGSVDTVVVAFTDMQGRLQGKRFHAHHFIDHVIAHGTEACSYLLTVDVEMTTVPGYALSSWETGYGDFALLPDLDTLRYTPGQRGCATVLGDLVRLGGAGPVRPSPRGILKEQVTRARSLGLQVLAGTELEFIVFEDSYESAWERRYQGLTGANRYNVDYSVLGGARVEPLLREIRNEMFRSGAAVEGAKGECNLGQHEIVFRYDDAVRTCDNHVVYKNAAKEIAAAHGQSLTFMAKYDEREGNSCHIHLSLRSLTGGLVCVDGSRPGGQSVLFDRFLAGVLASLPELTYFYAPNVNSYKRYQSGSFAPTAIAWGRDNRTCALRVVGEGSALRLENRVPGGDVNPYLAVAAMIAGGLDGIERELAPPEPVDGDAYAADTAQLPRTLADARILFAGSVLARESFGADVVDHYVHAAGAELAAFEAAVTDWERVRGFERL